MFLVEPELGEDVKQWHVHWSHLSVIHTCKSKRGTGVRCMTSLELVVPQTHHASEIFFAKRRIAQCISCQKTALVRRTRATQRTSHVKLSALGEASCDWSKAIIYIHTLYNLYGWCCKSWWNYRELEINQNGWTVQPHYHATFVAPIQMTGMLRLTLYMERFLPKPQHLLKFIRGTCQRNSILLTVCLKVTHANK